MMDEVFMAFYHVDKRVTFIFVLMLKPMDIGQFDSQPEVVCKKEKEEEPPGDENDARKANEPTVVVKPPPVISELDLTSGWETIKNGANLNQTVSVPDFNNSELPLTQGEDGQQVQSQTSTAHCESFD